MITPETVLWLTAMPTAAELGTTTTLPWKITVIVPEFVMPPSVMVLPLTAIPTARFAALRLSVPELAMPPEMVLRNATVLDAESVIAAAPIDGARVR